tara:strand:+ start:208 stop:378 length:171 start_codon:yes stop_codon:yes gene_type:complete
MTLKEKIAFTRKLDKLKTELATYTQGVTMREPFGTYNRGKAAALTITINELMEKGS